MNHMFTPVHFPPVFPATCLQQYSLSFSTKSRQYAFISTLSYWMQNTPFLCIGLYTLMKSASHFLWLFLPLCVSLLSAWSHLDILVPFPGVSEMFRFGYIELKSCRLSCCYSIWNVYFVISIGVLGCKYFKSVTCKQADQHSRFLLYKLLQERVWLDTKVMQYLRHLWYKVSCQLL